MNSSVTISGVVSSYQKKDGTRQIKLRVTYKRKTKYLPTNLFAYPSQLNKNGGIKDSALKVRVTALELQMYEKIREIDIMNSLNMDVDQIVEKMIVPEKEPFHFDIINHFDTFSKDKKRNTRNTYMFSQKCIKENMGIDHLDIMDVDTQFLDDLVKKLVDKYGERARSVSLVFTAFGTIYSDARKIAKRQGVSIDNALEDYERPNKPKPRHRDLSHEFIQDIIDKRKDIPYRAQREALDIFLLSFALFGINLIDMFNCAPPKNGIITFNRIKVADRRDDDAEVCVRIPQCIRKLYDRYADPTGKRAFRFYLKQPRYEAFYTSFSSAMKRATKTLGHPGEFTFYWARHSFATLGRANGIDKGMINDCLAHVDPNTKITDIYIRKDWKRHQEENDKMLATFDWTNL